jgi:hypothetical protein
MVNHEAMHFDDPDVAFLVENAFEQAADSQDLSEDGNMTG